MNAGAAFLITASILGAGQPALAEDNWQIELGRAEQSDQVSENSDIELVLQGNRIRLGYYGNDSWSFNLASLSLSGRLAIDESRVLSGDSYQKSLGLDYANGDWLLSVAYSQAGDELSFRGRLVAERQELTSDIWQFGVTRFWSWQNWNLDVSLVLGKINQDTSQASASLSDRGLQTALLNTTGSGLSGAASISVGYAVEHENWLFQPAITLSSSKIINGDEEIANLLVQRNSDRLNLTRFVDAEQISREFEQEQSLGLMFSMSHIDGFGVNLGVDRVLGARLASNAWSLSLWASF